MGCLSCLGACSCSSVPRGMAMVPVRSIALGHFGQGETVAQRPVYEVRSVIVGSALNPEEAIARVQEKINASANWRVQTFTVNAEDVRGDSPLLRIISPLPFVGQFVPKIMRVRWRLHHVSDVRGQAPLSVVIRTSRQLDAFQTIQRAVIGSNLKGEFLKEWTFEVKEEIVKPTIESLTPPGICDAIKKTTGWSCTSLGIIGGGVLVVGVLGWLIVPIVARTVLTVGTESVVRRAIGSHSNASRRRRRSRP